jgi:Ca2+-transporting ATPase
MGRFLGIIIFISIAFIFLLGIGEGRSFSEMLFVSIAVAVAAIPEGLPVAVSIVLVVGMERILSKGGLVKHLVAAETLGSTSVILLDKTGTLTKAEMQVSKIITLAPDEKDRLQVLEMALFTSEAFIENPNEELKEWVIRGNPMDKAILLASLELDLNSLEIIKNNPRLDFIPFDSERRFSASLNKTDSKSRIYLKGSPELVLSMCSHVYKEGKVIKLTEKEIKLLSHNYEIETAKGIRMLAVAYREGDWGLFPHHQEVGSMIENMIFGGFIGFHDPLREDVIEAIKITKESKIRPVMVTGDHVVTAKRIAEEVGLMDKNGIFLDGDNLERMSDTDLMGVIGKVDVFARVLPHQKLRIVRALQSNGEVVAMTGDGVNDAPALKNADIGLALSSGTEVAKEASDIILLNNSFSVISFAIQEGRRILDNLRKIVIFLFSTSFKEIILVGVTMILGIPLPILPAQILWLNIIEDGIINFAFAFEAKEENLITRDPKRQSSKNILSKSTRNTIYIIAVISSIFLISLFLFLFYSGQPIEKIRTIMFAGMSVGSVFFAISLKNMKKPIWRINIFSNIYLIVASLINIIVLFGALYMPFLQKLLSTVPLYLNDFVLVLSVGIFYIITIEFVKYFLFWKNKA